MCYFAGIYVCDDDHYGNICIRRITQLVYRKYHDDSACADGSLCDQYACGLQKKTEANNRMREQIYMNQIRDALKQREAQENAAGQQETQANTAGQEKKS